MSHDMSVKATLPAVTLAAATAAVAWAAWREASCRPVSAVAIDAVLTVSGLAGAWAAFSFGPVRWRMPARVTLGVLTGVVGAAVSYAAIFVVWAANCAN